MLVEQHGTQHVGTYMVVTAKVGTMARGISNYLKMIIVFIWFLYIFVSYFLILISDIQISALKYEFISFLFPQKYYYFIILIDTRNLPLPPRFVHLFGHLCCIVARLSGWGLAKPQNGTGKPWRAAWFESYDMAKSLWDSMWHVGNGKMDGIAEGMMDHISMSLWVISSNIE